MSKIVDLNLNPDSKTLRQFGYIALVGFGGIGALAWYEKAIFAFGLGSAREPVAYVFFGLAALSLLFSLVYPKANRPIYIGIAVVTYPIGFVLSYVIMGVLFFVVFGVAALGLKLFGRDPMNRAYNPKASSYWTERQGERPTDSYFQQY